VRERERERERGREREREREREGEGEGGNAWRNPDNKSFLRDNFERCASRARAGIPDTDSLGNLCSSSPPHPLSSACR